MADKILNMYKNVIMRLNLTVPFLMSDKLLMRYLCKNVLEKGSNEYCLDFQYLQDKRL